MKKPRPALLLSMHDLAKLLGVTPTGTMGVLDRLGVTEEYRTPGGCRLWTPAAAARVVKLYRKNPRGRVVPAVSP